MEPAEEATDEVTNTVDCAQVCQKYDECVAEIDVTSCTDQCEDVADNDETYEEQAQSCEDCLSDKSCQDSTSCWANCPVVPVQD